MRVRGLVLAVGVVAAGLVGVPGVASAATPVCRFEVPAKLTISHRDSLVSFGWGAGCPKTAFQASWVGQAAGVSGSSAAVMCTWGYPQCAIALDGTYPGSTMYWNPSGYAQDEQGRKVAELRSAKSLTKYGAAVKLAAGRVGTKTALTARPTYYSAKAKGFVRHHGRVLFQSKDPGSSVWKDLGYVVPSSAGTATFTITTNRSRAYRAYVASSATVWYAYSPNVTK
ncbi:hypothetical protein GCM10009745_51500 [Kribbella yunnanensis]|uniref:Uncharacterized protein n=1 Tax=Kribbella yunnanensis TaxID=190194 RepID=A0ABN2I5B4_9ACTN